MSYQALLFCPDEKTARIVSQVLSELEFSVEPCHEPFAAVKKLMVQHFDAIVVDCDNEQNAALLFKSARNSGSNQTSLAVAVVEGQAGVAKAFRLGANLVLTKPIHVEQSKATLRVARGLLRKGQAAKPPATVPGFRRTSWTSNHCLRPRPFRPPRADRTAGQPALPPLNLMPNQRRSPIRSTRRCSSTCRTLHHPLRKIRMRLRLILRSPSNIPGSRASPWRSRWRLPCGEPRKLRENPNLRIRQPVRPPQPRPQLEAELQPRRRAPGSESHSHRIENQEPAKTASGKTDESEQSAAEVWQAHSAAVKAEASEFASLDDTRDALAAQQSSGKGGSKKGLVVAVVLLGVAAAGYFGWTRMQSRQAQPVQQSVAPAQTSLASQPPAPETAAPEAQPSSPEASAQTGTDLDRVRTSIIFEAFGRSPIRNCRFQDGISGGKTGWNRQSCDSAQSSRSRDPSAVRAAVGKKR